jgi:hypothetical protein
MGRKLPFETVRVIPTFAHLILTLFFVLRSWQVLERAASSIS